MLIIYDVRIGTEGLEFNTSITMDTTDGDINWVEDRAIAEARLNGDLEGNPTYIAVSVSYKEGDYHENLVPPTCDEEFWNVLKTSLTSEALPAILR